MNRNLSTFAGGVSLGSLVTLVVGLWTLKGLQHASRKARGGFGRGERRRQRGRRSISVTDLHPELALHGGDAPLPLDGPDLRSCALPVTGLTKCYDATEART